MTNSEPVDNPDPGSFRDPAGRIYAKDGRIFRTVTPSALDGYRAIRDSGALEWAMNAGLVIGTREVDPRLLAGPASSSAFVLEHDRIPFVSYPYEWSFSALKAAALHHLELQIGLLDRGVSLSDASAYNIQFIGPKPVFIDVLSLKPYEEGEFWLGHKQFCEQFLNPLLLRSIFGVPHNSWYRGALEGIPTGDFARMLPLLKKFSLRMQVHVCLPNRFQRKALAEDTGVVPAVTKRRLPRAGYLGLLTQLQGWIAGLSLADTGPTVWGSYAEENTYGSEERQAKKKFITEFASSSRCHTLWDLGCNTGDFSKSALEGGAQYVIGFDYDLNAIDRAFARAKAESMNLLPLLLDAANPSPGQGWDGRERKSLDDRKSSDAIVALAFIHHLAIGRNIPLDRAVGWLVGLAPQGVIEFVQKTDPTVRKMLALRADIFPDYTEEAFTAVLTSLARITRREVVSSTGRTLYAYER